ncbi:hypothetical protein BDZ97DRAFT_2067235 [Flammula alnicola]|nr:hypothetical protein BDZ97DRAFT_2067235 [Flammula alnicola]
MTSQAFSRSPFWNRYSGVMDLLLHSFWFLLTWDYPSVQSSHPALLMSLPLQQGDGGRLGLHETRDTGAIGVMLREGFWYHLITVFSRGPERSDVRVLQDWCPYRNHTHIYCLQGGPHNALLQFRCV